MWSSGMIDSSYVFNKQDDRDGGNTIVSLLTYDASTGVSSKAEVCTFKHKVAAEEYVAWKNSQIKPKE
jgi:hypothetical protein